MFPMFRERGNVPSVLMFPKGGNRMQKGMLLFFLPIPQHSKELEFSAALDECLGDLA